MPAQKRSMENESTKNGSKKLKIADSKHERHTPSSGAPLRAEELDFPRGGGTSFTPLEVKTIRAEAVKEANVELFEDTHVAKKSKKRKRGPDGHTHPAGENANRVRIEHLNYKRLNVGMKIFGQIVGILPLSLLVSLPNQLSAHVPITNISSQFTSALERMDNISEGSGADDEEGAGLSDSDTPDLSDIFRVGQYVRAVVSAIHAPGSSEASSLGKSRDEASKASRRVELSLVPERVNAGVQKADLKNGFTMTAAVKSVEDHGYIFDLGISGVEGFLAFKDTKMRPSGSIALDVGRLLDVSVTKLSANGRTCNVTTDQALFSSSYVTEMSSVTSVLPGALVQSLITAIHPTGLNLQVLGFFEGTVDPVHLKKGGKAYQVGKKVRARILYEYSSSPPRFALALVDHLTNLSAPCIKSKELPAETKSIQEAFPLGTIIESAKVLRVETERGIIVEVQPGVEGFVHISHLSEDHVPSLSSTGPWKPGTLHRARVTGYFSFDGLLQLSFKPSIIEQKFLQVSDVEVGEVIKGTIKKLTDSGLFVSLSRSIDGVVWPNHYADITLKHPEKRFKPGVGIKCKVLAVDVYRKRISLTAKKTLLDSNLPILSKIDDAKPGFVTHAVIFKVYDNHLLVEFYNNLKAIVPAKEISDIPINKLSDSFPIGRVVRTRIISVDTEQGRIVASIRQALGNKDPVSDISAVEIGNIVKGSISEIHKDNALIILQPTQIRALLSLKNLANFRQISLGELLVKLKVGDELDELVVVTRNPDKGVVIVANTPKKVPLLKGSSVSIDSLKVGQIVGGRVTRHTRHSALIKVTPQIGGTLHPTDISDDYDTGLVLPPVDSILRAAIIEIDRSKNQLRLSTRHSKMYPESTKKIVDQEIIHIFDIHVGDTVRGSIKSVADHGLFVTIGRDIDARVQIRELFDDFVEDWKARFQEKQIVKGLILSVDLQTRKVEMTLKSGDLSTRNGSSVGLADLKVGQKVDGLVKRIEDYGLFINIDRSKLNGLCHKSQLSDSQGAGVSFALNSFHEGDRVKAVIIGIDKARISLSLKPSLFNEEDFQEGADTNEPIPEPSGVIKNDNVETSDDDEDEEVDISDSEGEGDDVMDVDIDQPLAHSRPVSAQKPRVVSTAPIPSLALSGGFQWSFGEQQLGDDYDAESPSSESDLEGDEYGKRKTKRRRKAIEHDLTAEMHTKSPESNADFERLLLGSPNSSYLWIQYMSFQLQLSEVEKSREIGRRAIETINFREEQEKLNVWIALLNLENVYGTLESLETTFKQAARANDSKTVHLRLASIFDQSDKLEKAEEQFNRTCKKFGQSSKVWTLFSEYYLKRGNMEESRKLLPRSLLSLDKRKHLKTISRFAQLEYKYGDPERGRTLFEGIVDSHPKRWDLWSIYMDMEGVQKNIQGLRNLFERVLTLHMTSHKAKSFFKKWLELEKRIGDEEGVSDVKTKAVEWTRRASNAQQ